MCARLTGPGCQFIAESRLKSAGDRHDAQANHLSPRHRDGACLTVLISEPQGAHLVAAAKAAARADNIYSQLNLFGEVFERIKADYVEKPDDAKLIEGAVNGMLSSLDPHSRYKSAKGFTEMQETTSGQFGGLGMEVTMEEGLVKVVAPIDDTPAAKAGILSGDLITHVDDEAVQGLPLDQAVAKMKGAPNTAVRLTIIRKGSDKPINVSIMRENIRVRAVRHRIDGGDIGYIRIPSFDEQTTVGLRKAIAAIASEIPADKLTGYVVDLRNNPGGLLDQAVSVSSAFWGAAKSSPRAAAMHRKPSAWWRAAATSRRASRWSC